MTVSQQMITIAMVVLGTMLTRFLPFILFPAGKPTPKYVQFLGKALPGAGCVGSAVAVLPSGSMVLISGSREKPDSAKVGISTTVAALASLAMKSMPRRKHSISAEIITKYMIFFEENINCLLSEGLRGRSFAPVACC